MPAPMTMKRLCMRPFCRVASAASTAGEWSGRLRRKPFTVS